MTEQKPYGWTTQDMVNTLRNVASDFQNRVNFAAAVITNGQTVSRKFSDCFEMYDGDAVCLALLLRTRARKDTLLAQGIWKYLDKDSVQELAQKYSERKPHELQALSNRLIKDAQNAN